LKPNQNIQISVDVQNAGALGGDEVVQLYLTDVAASVPVPIRSLRGIQRIHLKPGERRRVSFTLRPEDLAVTDNNGQRMLEPGEFTVSVGGKQPGFKGSVDAATTGVVTGSFSVTGSVTQIP
jgi:beta-glucosidase